jgi:hypothetical protein
MYQLPKSRDLGVNSCDACLDKQREIDRLREEVARLRSQLCQRQRDPTATPFGSSTPSSKIPLKPNTTEEQSAKRGGAQVGHPGHGRRGVTAADAERVIAVTAAASCPQCGGALIAKGWPRQKRAGDAAHRGRTCAVPLTEEVLRHLSTRGLCHGSRRLAQEPLRQPTERARSNEPLPAW